MDEFKIHGQQTLNRRLLVLNLNLPSLYSNAGSNWSAIYEKKTCYHADHVGIKQIHVSNIA